MHSLISAWGEFRGLSPFAPQMVTNSQFADLQSVSTSSTLDVFGTELIYALNSVFACGPGLSAGGNVYEYSILSLIYQRSKVVAVTMEIDFEFPLLAGASTPGIMVGADLSVLGDTTPLQGQLVTVAAKKFNIVTKMLNNNGNQKVTIKKSFPIYKCLNVTKLEHLADNINFVATTNGLPNQIAYLRLAIANSINLSILNCNVRVRLNYKTQWYDKLAPAG